MKNNLIKILSVLASIVMLATSCKKDEEPVKAYTLIGIIDSASTAQSAALDYDSEGKLLRFGVGSAFSYNYYYNGNNISVRIRSANNIMQSTDSFFYDGASRLVRIEKYDENAVKVSTLQFGYNGDNTVNTINVDYVDPGDDDLLYEYTYANGDVTMRTESHKVGGSFKINNKFEILGYDDKINPFHPLYKKYFLDEVYLYYYLWAGVHNATSAKLTTYDLVTGDAIDVAPGTTTFTYNADNYPLTAKSISGTTETKVTYNYKAE